MTEAGGAQDNTSSSGASYTFKEINPGLAVRLGSFGLVALTQSVLPWTLLAVFALYVLSGGRDVAGEVLKGILLFWAVGVIVGVPTAGVLRRLENGQRVRAAVRLSAQAGLLLVSALLWWVITTLLAVRIGIAAREPMRSLAVHPGSGVALSWVLFMATYLFLDLPSRRLDAAKWSRFQRLSQRSYGLRPKALSGDYGNPSAVRTRLEKVERAVGQSPRVGSKLLAGVRGELEVVSDPRYHTPATLDLALDFLRRELEYRGLSEGWRPVDLVVRDGMPVGWLVEPAALCAAGVFAVEYQLSRQKDRVSLAVSFCESPLPLVRIHTAVAGHDCWFVVGKGTRAFAAKERLVQALNRAAQGGHTFSSVEDSEGHVAFDLSARPAPEPSDVWPRVEVVLGEHAHLLSSCDLSGGGSRVYKEGSVVHKVQLLGGQGPKPLSLVEENVVLRLLDGVDGIPRSHCYVEHPDFSVLSLDAVDGTNLHDYLTRSGFERKTWFRCIAELTALLEELHGRGVVHRDLRPENVIVGDDGRVFLVDFDQAIAGAHNAAEVDTCGAYVDGIPPAICMDDLVHFLGLGDEYDAAVSDLRRAWDIGAESSASSPGDRIAYYRWMFGSAEFPGERDWFARWSLVRRVVLGLPPGARVLELGCNMGLLSTYCMLHGAGRAVAVDLHNDVLHAGSILSQVAGVDVEFVQGDLNLAEFVASHPLTDDYDLVVAFSLLHWLDDQRAVKNLLSSASRLLYEGHQSTWQDMELLHALGFPEIALLGFSERLRGVYLASRGGA